MSLPAVFPIGKIIFHQILDITEMSIVERPEPIFSYVVKFSEINIFVEDCESCESEEIEQKKETDKIRQEALKRVLLEQIEEY